MAILDAANFDYLYVIEAKFMNLINHRLEQANHVAQVGVNQSQESQSQHYEYDYESTFVKLVSYEYRQSSEH